jgi:hypothetical protein
LNLRSADWSSDAVDVDFATEMHHRRWRGLDRAADWRWLILPLWLGLIAALPVQRNGDGDWEFFRRGAGALLGNPILGSPGGVHLYASRPDLQIGPPALVAAVPFRLLPRPSDVDAARILMCIILLVVIAMTESICSTLDVPPRIIARVALLGGALVIPAWVTVAVTEVHLDDVMVVGFSTAAVFFTGSKKPMWAAAAVGLAVASKPWGIVVVPLLFQPGLRHTLRACVVAVGVAIAWWLPFLSDPHTVTALWHFRLDVSANSGLALLGVGPGPMPGWARPAQLVTAVLLGVLAARRGHWIGVPLVGFAVRVALDPATFAYYEAAPIIGALIWDMSRSRSGVPWATGIAVAGFAISSGAGNDLLGAAVHALTCLALVVSVLVQRRPPAIPQAAHQLVADVDLAIA